jgi:murein L,D-transpeptidase YcbB/YkuD
MAGGLAARHKRRRLGPVPPGVNCDVLSQAQTYGGQNETQRRALRFVATCALFVLVMVAGCGGHVQAPSSSQPVSPPARAWSEAALTELREAADMAVANGLAPPSQALNDLDRLEPLSLSDPEAARVLDEAADRLFSNLATAFAVGGTDPALVDPDWRIASETALNVEALRRAVRGGAGITQTLANLLPASPEYAALVAELAHVRDASSSADEGADLSRSERETRLRASLERWRWLPRTWPARRLEVLVPFFELRMRDGESSLTHAVIVGARRTQTPAFAAAIETITLNPTWTPPSSILMGELVPRFRRDPDAVSREGFDVLDRSGRTVDPAAVDWRARPFPYTLRQRPGANNALGRLRFDLPNPYAVFLHDTPSRGLFTRADRALSHGCIRVAEPLALAATVLADPAWDQVAIEAAIDADASQTIRLANPLPIYVLYITATADRTGVVRYADDIYRRDGAIVRALDRPYGAVQTAVRRTSPAECART